MVLKIPKIFKVSFPINMDVRKSSDSGLISFQCDGFVSDIFLKVFPIPKLCIQYSWPKKKKKAKDTL